MSIKASAGGVRGGHELAPLNTLADGGGGSGREHGVRIVLQGSRGSLQREPPPDRAEWSGKLQFFLSIIGYSVGLGNVWRFPYLCQKNGGGAFLIPFLIMLFLEGIPLFLIEMAIGQKMRLGALGVWNTIHPWLGGLGISSIIVTMFVALYYNVIITWVIFYLLNSINIKLPWAECPAVNTTGAVECGKASETAYFWYRNALDVAPAIDEPGAPRWWIVLCLLIAWTIVFFIMMKGIQSSGKVVYFTSMFPYIVLTIFFIRGITLDGAGAGIIHMMNPKMEMLLKPKVWLDAATQVFFSFGLAFGSLIAFGSYNPPDNHCVRDVILVSICNALTAIYASVVIFSILGFKAYTMVNRCVPQEVAVVVTNNLSSISLNATKEEFYAVYENINQTVRDHFHLTGCNMTTQLDQAAEGTGLAFIVITEAITALPISPFWSIIFFLMLLSLGLGSQIGFMEGMLCTIFDIDIFKRISKPYLTGVVCGFCFIVGLLFTTGAGEYWVQVFDSLAGTIGLVVIAFLETVAVIYIYGHEKFSNDIYEMTGYRPGLYWQLTWRYIGPFIILTILVSSIVSMFTSPPEYAAWDATKGRVVKQPYPDWVLAIAISMIVASVLPIPGVFLLRRFQCLSLDVDIHQGSIRRIETTVSTKEMMADQDVISPEYSVPPPALAAHSAKFTIGDFDSEDSEDGAVMTRGRYEAHGDGDSSSDDDAASITKRGRISMRTRKKFEMEVLEI